MLQFIIDNISTMLVGLVVLAAVAAVIISMARKRKIGESASCGCSCSGCAGACHTARDMSE